MLAGSREGMDKAKTILKNMGMHLSLDEENSIEFTKKKIEEDKKV